MSLSIADVFRKYDLDLDPRDFARELDRSLELNPAPTAISRQMVRDLEEYGGLRHPEWLRGWSGHDNHSLSSAVHATMLADLLAATVSAAQRGIINGLTGSEHPLDVAIVMTTPAEELDGRTPADYLISGGESKIVAELLSGLA